MSNLLQKVFFFSGKGGVGKSTLAAAFALKAAKENLRTLLVSIDPAHNLSDLFNIRIGENTLQIIKHLFAIEIDPQKESDKYIKGVKKSLKNLVHIDMATEVEQQLDLASTSPGAQESAVFDKITRLVLDKYDQYDRIIFDMAPTGHAIHLLSLPEAMDGWINKMVERRTDLNQFYAKSFTDQELPEDPIYQQLLARQQRFKKIRRILLDQTMTSYFFVIVPERLALLETQRAVLLLEKYSFKVGQIIVNKVLPMDDKTSDFLVKRQMQQRKYIKLIENSFKRQNILYVPLLDSDIYGLESLEEIACYFS